MNPIPSVARPSPSIKTGERTTHSLQDRWTWKLCVHSAPQARHDPHNIVAAPRLPLLTGETSVDLTLSEYPLENAECAGYDANTKGFRLTMISNGITRTLNNDTTVPKSRRCPFSYRIERFFTFFPDEAPPVFAILIQMESLGFEGPDRRYLAITGRL